MKHMLAGTVDFVIVVDTHGDWHIAAVVDAATGGSLAQLTFPAKAIGYRRLAVFADERAAGRRGWAIEGTGSYGSGLTTSLLEHRERGRRD